MLFISYAMPPSHFAPGRNSLRRTIRRNESRVWESCRPPTAKSTKRATHDRARQGEIVLSKAKELLPKIQDAVQAANEAERAASAARDELVSRSKALGLLLLEAKRMHPTRKAFEEYLSQVDGLKISRAYDLLRLAGGRTTDEELRKEARERQAKSRAKKKLRPDIPQPEPKAIATESVTVTDSEPNTEQQKHGSKSALQDFLEACDTHLPLMNVADLQVAFDHFNFMIGQVRKAA
jgi:hypothetical protein